MKHTTHFVSTRLVSLVLSLFLVFGTAASSLSAVTDLSITDQPASAAPALDGAAGTVASAADASYGVAEGSLLAQPADDDVLDIALDDDTPAAALSAPLTLSRDKNTDLAATGALTATEYYIGSQNSNYKLVNENGWKIKDTSKTTNQYMTVNYGGNQGGSISWTNNGTTFTEGTSTSSTVQLSCTVGSTYNSRTYYISYNNGSFAANITSSNHVPIVAAVTSYIVTFNANGGTGTMADQTISGTANLTANAFIREGYSFTGWNTVADGTGTSYADKASVTLTTSITLYAQWQQDAPPASANMLYFTRVDNWNNLKAYIYNSSTGAKVSEWPGENMQYEGKNSFDEDIYSITVDPDNYDYIIFNSGDNQTVNINISDALANGAGIYYSGQIDSAWHCYVNFYTYGDKSSTGDPNTVTYTKQIEKLNPSNADDYNYRLHLNVDGTALSDIRTVPGEPIKDRKIGILLDVTETMLSTWSGSDNGDNKFDGVRQLLQGSDGFLNSILDGHTEVYIIVVGGQQGSASYTQLSDKVASGTTLGDFSNINNSLHVAQGISYVTGLKAAELYLGNDIDSLVYIIGNETDTYVKYSDGQVDRGVTGTDAKNKNYADYLTFMGNHPDLSMYTVYVTPANRGTDIAQQMGEYSVNRGTGGGYYEASDSATLKEKLTQISEEIKIPGDKTSNITVTDTLSKYVDFATNKNLTATLYTDYNSTTQEWSTTDVSSLVSVTGDTVTFSRTAEIEGPFKLEIAFNIKTADGVLRNTDTYGTVRDGYPNVGDDDTDFTTATSAGKSGYYANSSATIRYTLNDTTVNGTFIKPVVQAPAETPVQGKYIFKYTDRYGDTRTVEVPVKLNSNEKNGYSGNNYQQNVPTFLWTTEAQALFTKNPLVDAALALEGNAETGGENWQKDASVYKRDLVWDNLVATTKGDNVTYDATAHTVTIQATTTPYTFTLLYHTVSDGTATLQGTATGLEYGKAVTFNPIYSGSTEYAYVDYTVPSDGFSYWSADEAGNIPITTNLTYGMIMRGDYMHDDDDDRIVHIYAQYNKAPDKLWNPLIEEAKLTHTIEDTDDSQIDWLYLDYMTNYLSKEGTVVQEMETKPEYGIVVAKYDSTLTTLTQEKMESVADKMIEKDKSSAYLDSGKTAIAYRFNYSDSEHISDFNRTLYTLKSNTSAAENKKFTAIAYIIVDETTYYSLINTDITVIDLVN